ncbi:MAG: type II toxin-antitoxin system VapC family toxin [Candidatus Latescibacterota bacterium]
MTGIDTNVLVRYLTQDDPDQAARVNALMSETEARDERLFANDVVLCELVWVLESAYQFDKADIAGAVDRLLATRQLEFEDKDLLRLALDDYRASSADFSDCLIGRRNAAGHCTTTWSLDRGMGGLSLFSLL